jgi:hypothetical protein
MVKSLIFLVVLISMIANADGADEFDMRPYLPKGKYTDPDRGCQVEVTHEALGKIKVGFTVTPNPTHINVSLHDYVIGGKSWIEIDALTGKIVNGEYNCWKEQEKIPETQFHSEDDQQTRFVYANSCSLDHSQAEKIQIQAFRGQFYGLVFQREVFRVRPSSDGGLVYEGLEEMHFGCKLAPEITVGSN